MTPITITVPDALTAQKAELEATLAGISTEEKKLAAQRQELQAALTTLATGIAVLSGQPLPVTKAAPATTRKPMSDEAKKRIGEGLRKYREAKALAKAAQLATPALLASAPEPGEVLAEVSAPETTGEAPADAPVLVSAPEEPAEAPAEAPVPDSPRALRATRKGARA
jgi:hypothetical protein